MDTVGTEQVAPAHEVSLNEDRYGVTRMDAVEFEENARDADDDRARTKGFTTF